MGNILKILIINKNKLTFINSIRLPLGKIKKSTKKNNVNFKIQLSKSLLNYIYLYVCILFHLR